MWVSDIHFASRVCSQFQYSGSSPHRNVPFQITWGAQDPKPLDNPEIIQGASRLGASAGRGGCVTGAGRVHHGVGVSRGQVHHRGEVGCVMVQGWVHHRVGQVHHGLGLGASWCGCVKRWVHHRGGAGWGASWSGVRHCVESVHDR